MFGEEDVLAERNYSSTVVCKSNTAEAYCIKNAEFFRKMKANNESWKIIVFMSMAKEKAIYRRIK